MTSSVGFKINIFIFIIVFYTITKFQSKTKNNIYIYIYTLECRLLRFGKKSSLLGSTYKHKKVSERLAAIAATMTLAAWLLANNLP